MKVPPRDAGRFVASPPRNLRAVLIYGENAGLARDYAGLLTAHIVPNTKDAERIVDIAAADLRKDPARLSDEAAQMSMFSPGRRVLRVRDATEGMGEIFAEFLKTAKGDALTIVEAGELNARASLRIVFEAAPDAAAIACYEDDPAAMVELAGELLRERNIAAAPEVMEALIARLGLDRRILRIELDKLDLFFGQGGGPHRLTKDIVDLLFGQSGDVEASEVAAAVALGEHVKLDQLLEKSQEAGASASYLITTSLRHLHALYAAKAHGSGGDEVTMARQRGLWGQSDAMIRAQLRLWSPERLTAAMRVLGQAEGDTRTTSRPEWPVASRALLHAARLVTAR